MFCRLVYKWLVFLTNLFCVFRSVMFILSILLILFSGEKLSVNMHKTNDIYNNKGNALFTSRQM